MSVGVIAQWQSTGGLSRRPGFDSLWHHLDFFFSPFRKSSNSNGSYYLSLSDLYWSSYLGKPRPSNSTCCDILSIAQHTHRHRHTHNTHTHTHRHTQQSSPTYVSNNNVMHMYIPAHLLPLCLPLHCSKCYHSLVQLHMDNRGLHDTARLEKAWKVIKEALKAVRVAPPVSLRGTGNCVCVCGYICSNVLCCAVLYDVTHQRRFLAEHVALAKVQCRRFQHKRSLLTAKYKMLRTCT